MDKHNSTDTSATAQRNGAAQRRSATAQRAEAEAKFDLLVQQEREAKRGKA